MCMRQRARMYASGNEPRKMSHIDMKKRAHLVGDPAEFREINHSRVGGSTGDDEARPVFPGQGLNLAVFSYAGFLHFGINADPDIIEDVSEDRLIEVLEEAHRRFGRDFDIAWALVTMLRDRDDTERAREVAEILASYYPADANVASLLKSLPDSQK